MLTDFEERESVRQHCRAETFTRKSLSRMAKSAAFERIKGSGETTPSLSGGYRHQLRQRRKMCTGRFEPSGHT